MNRKRRDFMLPAEGILLNIVASHTCTGEYSSAKFDFRLGLLLLFFQHARFSTYLYYAAIWNIFLQIDSLNA